MGVYFFVWRHADFRGRTWVKVGHYCKSNPWSRCARRGFSSCVLPSRDMRGRVTGEEMELLAWFPEMSRRDEGKIHRGHKNLRIGEWYEEEVARKILAEVEATHENKAEGVDKEAAFATRRRL